MSLRPNRQTGGPVGCVDDIPRVESLVSNPMSCENAKPEVGETEQARLQDLKERQQRLNQILQELGG